MRMQILIMYYLYYCRLQRSSTDKNLTTKASCFLSTMPITSKSAVPTVVTKNEFAEVFGGKLTVRQALIKLRSLLLDLTGRNPVLNFRLSKTRTLQFAGEPNLNLIFDRLSDSKPIPLAYVQMPDPDTYLRQPPDARTHAQRIPINVGYQFGPQSIGSYGPHIHVKLQALFYPEQLAATCKRLSSHARMVVEETGTNMLHLLFGFLEYYESDDSDKMLLAPLIAVPVILDKDKIDPETRTQLYTLTYSGEDIHENHTLVQKLKKDFQLELPEFEEADTPGQYFKKVQHAVRTRKRWVVRNQLTLGFLSFAKLAMWAELDPDKNDHLLSNPLLHDIFSGKVDGGAGAPADDYQIDAHKLCDIPLIYDADSSQHSAVIDALTGKNLVINGPPGTGKSQTITNVIAVALGQGKRVLFVAEKLAALEVVRHRLDKAQLGDFCLELHSHKTQRKRLVKDLESRLNKKYQPPANLDQQIAVLKRQKAELNRYAELMGMKYGNEMGLTVHEVFWRAELKRQRIERFAEYVGAWTLDGASTWTLDAVEARRSQLDTLGDLFTQIGTFDQSHVWWGFAPKSLAPGDEEAIALILRDALTDADALIESVSEFISWTGTQDEPSLFDFAVWQEAIDQIPGPPESIQGDILQRAFDPARPEDHTGRDIVAEAIKKIAAARAALDRAAATVRPDCVVEYGQIEPTVVSASKVLRPEVFAMPLSALRDRAQEAQEDLNQLTQLVAGASQKCMPISTEHPVELGAKLGHLSSFELRYVQLGQIRTGTDVLLAELNRLREAFVAVARIASSRELSFNGTQEAVALLGHLDGIQGIRQGVAVDDNVLNFAQKASEYHYSTLPLTALKEKHQTLVAEVARIGDICAELQRYAEQVAWTLSGSLHGYEDFRTISVVAANAPMHLLSYRREALENSRVPALVAEGEKSQQLERSQCERLGEEFYLDTLPEVDDLKSAVRAYRRGDRFLNFLNSEWRAAKRVFRDISKQKNSKKTAAELEAGVTAILGWLDHKNAYLSRPEFAATFGDLFTGLDTKYEDIRTLHAWYVDSERLLLQRPGLLERFQLSAVEERQLHQLASLRPTIDSLLGELDGIKGRLGTVLQGCQAQIERALLDTGWGAYTEDCTKLAAGLHTVSEHLGRLVFPDVSPARAYQLLQAKRDVQDAAPHFEALQHGVERLLSAVEVHLPGAHTVMFSNWQDYLDRFNGFHQRLGELVQFVSTWGQDDVTIDQVQSLFAATLAARESLSELANVTDIEHIPSWQLLVDTAQARVSAATKLAADLLPATWEDKSAKSVVASLGYIDEAKKHLNALNTNPRIGEVLGAFYDGANTDTEALSATSSWGKAVCNQNRLRDSGLFALLFGPNAHANYSQAKTLLRKITEQREQVIVQLDRLTNWGEFRLDSWEKDSLESATALESRVSECLAHKSAVLPWAKYRQQRNDCLATGLRDYVTALESEKLPPESLGTVFEFVVFRTIGRKIYQAFPELQEFSAEKHNRKREDFAELDRKIIHLTGQHLAYEIDRKKTIPPGNAGPLKSSLTEMPLVKNEVSKQAKHIPIRQLLRRAGRTIQALKPCFMMGPLSVAQYLEFGALEFDLVVMDEASQLRPADAIGAIARAKQVVVVGDPNQLPPTSFFDRLDGDADEEDQDELATIDGAESILDICRQLFPERMLKFHYRSQHHSLIAFSNFHFYESRLKVFPAPYERNSRLGVRYRFVKNGVYRQGNNQNEPEAERVVAGIIEHMLQNPDESLGVVTLNLKQKELIEDLLEAKIRVLPQARDFCDKWEAKGWDFFVKNLENVQGDERDVIFISTTFGRAPGATSVAQRFGPITGPKGWRRLNVLFTRARRRVEVFSSMRPSDINVSPTSSRGTRALKDYLEYAQRGVLVETDYGTRPPDSDFEVAVGNMLRNAGYDIQPQLGVAGYFIDIAVRNSERPGEFLAAVECDGATYHSSSSARERDRIRQDILESLGWGQRFWRIWSTDWFFDPNRQSKRLLEFLDARKRAAAEEPSPDYDLVVAEDFDDMEPAGSYSDTTTSIPGGEPVQRDGGKARQFQLGDQLEQSSLNFENKSFVELFDRVTYIFIDNPSEEAEVQIVPISAPPMAGVTRIRETAPLGKALLDKHVDECVALSTGRVIEVVEIVKHRN